MSDCKRIAVLGGGSFGTVIANIAAENGYIVTLWMRSEEAVQQITDSRINQRYLPDLVLHENLNATTDLKLAITDAQLIFFAIPSKSFRDVVERVSGYVDSDQMVISTTKGIEPGTLNLMSDILRAELPHNRVGVMGGPNLAKEIAKHEITATVIASEDSDLRRIVQETLSCLYFRVYASADVYGVELGGALKNIYAIISGIAAAKKLGENTIAMLLTRSLAEMGRFAETQGANPMTFLGLSGVGDLIATACSPLSRNYRVGYAFGEGRNLDEAVAELGEVAEGVNTLKQVKRFADEHDIYMPLVQGLYKVLYGGESISAVIKTLMLAERNTDVEYTLPKDEI
ncbi:glycerol-3-phosphate dehydrogenase [Oleiphilus sp. HI0071]|jgi:glycerol-3-phosphate dehydrogenase (NAD(P)+)|uniref:NAD(P)H-dependent glycerol-3-phosphate dehydrogenase n=3 Tax=unclassified Oleiphilus TaxID=2631174 RepID=UPI0007C2458A|nr:NAD(P)H-dependent glycerol-3-phosphate dehydrogenase [Oleiphilus sp. HI0079]KZY61055.1 glycerol-3-phosphate dehydrogenase [Oleiphilus sp. HI0065]KZY89731.1 glycerol-3-phosphate dehydrogenase [Oleiphilus sp. HI0073]KZY90283.1 glycerol-3-phosphate dehydrogenase [Oleiphilus sp. HI0071]KZZ46435.1 glycerol-3-phosphate dehydrogenase [Oleiphilus sp. HI0118]KZZ55832.1 glycerol-3-phosphate dehydrogenase [Oleiphilus sp. HI0122]KZZ68014.1 glycerol-3-phosphate dehydrogenase [Oleiphilus sp. HI0130]KZZ